MFDWLPGILAKQWGTLTTLAVTLVNAIKAVTDTFVSVFFRLVTAFGYVGRMAYWLFQAGEGLAGETILAFIRLGTVILPGLLARVLSQAVDFTRAVINDLRNLLLAAINDVRNLASALISELRAQVVGWVNYLSAFAAKTWDLLVAVANRVTQLLTDPRALADWLAGNIVQAVLKWAAGNATTLTRLFLQGAIRGAVGIAALLERVIADVFL